MRVIANTQAMPDTVLRVLLLSTHLILIITMNLVQSSSPFLTVEETEAQSY